MATPTLLPLPEAAARLGLSQSALRRRLRNGAARGERRATPSGFMWWVDVEADVETPDAVRTPTAPQTPTRARTPTGERPQDGPGGTTLSAQSARAEEMAVYSERLLRPVLDRLERQAEELGTLRERVATLQARVAELEAPPSPAPATGSAPAPEEADAQPTPPPEPAAPPRLGWWQRAWGWLTAG